MTQVKLALNCAAVSLLLLLAACSSGVGQTDPFESQIVGGTKTDPGAYPFMAQIQDIDSPEHDSHACGGVLIERTWVLTAAHCVYNRSAEDFTVVLGEHVRGKDEGVEQSIDVRRIVIASGYNPFTFRNDLALLRLAKSATLNKRVGTANLSGLPAANTTLEAIGWGTTSEDGLTSTTLRQVSVPLVANATCEAAYPGEITSSMFCAGFSKGGKDICQGDSGGPILDSKARVVGFSSWGLGCARADAYGVYTKATRFSKWIKRTTDSN